MRATNSGLVLLDLHSSWHSANRIPTSVFAYLQCSHVLSSVSSSFRRARPSRKGIASSSSSSSLPSPSIRRPGDRFSIGNGVLSSNSSSSNSSLSLSRPDSAIISELDLFLELVPQGMRGELFRHEEIEEMIEVVMDLGRKPLARFPSGDWVISEQPVKVEDLRHAISKVGEFSEDNRSGINHSLHRISAIRNRKMQIIGLTCRVGRAISGSAEMIRDLIEGGGSILVIGPPGVGKTTLIREIARMLADEHMKRVIIVDTSNEIGGDGDVPHSGIGRARRMQVPNVNMQHNIMIEAVENHMPETIIIDEIGTELEAMAASTIAQRGVQLVGTAHGITIENIIKNPSLQILVGGIEILETDLLQVAQVMGLENDIDVTDDIGTANAVLASNSELKQNPWIRGVAKFHQLPIFVIKTNTMAQMVKAVRMILGMKTLGSVSGGPLNQFAKNIEIEDDAPKRKPSLEEIDALEEARLAIEYIVIPGGEPVELLPRCSEIIARQLELVESYQLAAEQSGTELYPRLQIFPHKLKKASVKYSASGSSGQGESTTGFSSLTGGGGGTSVVRLPRLPEQ
eukprot:TRINITY_DN22844_c0_g1_i4.p1 TRINITY_DN22844_c0_g1~~TRINITY_DN22844_c0_g1_i4.p1  ORF type:complete len:571 (+),score=95.40 TRINITY_DN22844_c0_g1_i4:216-1928(+)